MSNNEYVSVKEFAILTKTTYQSVYKQIQKGYLSPYTIIEDGKTLINIKATEIYPKRKGEQKGELVELVENEQGESEREKGESQGEQGENAGESVESQGEKVEPQGESVELVESFSFGYYIDRINQLERDLAEAKEAIQKKDQKIAELADRAFNLAEKIAELTQNSQILQAREQEKKGLFSSLKHWLLTRGKSKDNEE